MDWAIVMLGAAVGFGAVDRFLLGRQLRSKIAEVDEALTNEVRGLQTYCENKYARRRQSRKRNGRDAIPPPPNVVPQRDLDEYFGRSETPTEPASAPDRGSDS